MQQFYLEYDFSPLSWVADRPGEGFSLAKQTYKTSVSVCTANTEYLIQDTYRLEGPC